MLKIKLTGTIFLLLIFIQVAESQQLKRHVFSSGGNTSNNAIYKMKSSFGQWVIGKGATQNLVNGLGFWYMDLRPKPITLVKIPHTEAWIGNKIQIPVILQASRYLSSSNIKNFEARIRYNSSVLQPIEPTPECIPTGIDDCVITVKGELTDTLGVLANLNFVVRLGTVEYTPLVIESFEWIGSDRVEIMKIDGSLDILGICKEGDTSRFVKRSIKAGLQSVAPNPASNNILLNYSIREKGATRIVLMNNLGIEVAVLYQGEALPGMYSEFIDLTDYSSGLYFINMITETQNFNLKVIVDK